MVEVTVIALGHHAYVLRDDTSLYRRLLAVEVHCDVSERLAVEERVTIIFSHIDIDLSDAPFTLCHGGHIVGFLETQQDLAGHTDGVGEVGGIGRLVIEITVVAEES